VLVRSLLVSFLLPVSANAAVVGQQVYLDQLIARARAEKIWTRREWQVLMHYSPTLTGTGVVSSVDDEEFFLSDQGKVSPQAELETTLTHFFSSSPDDDEAIACRFPARLAWLTSALHINKNMLPAYQCTHLHSWLTHLDADGLTLIFPVSVLNSPGSMFGHTFLRFDRKQENKPDLLAWTVGYAAHSEGEDGLSFALNGLLGGYPGRFTLSRYHARVKAYSDIENRDLWEYELDYTRAEIHALLLHLWELLPVYFDYYFIDENCAYQLLAVMEAARPELALTQQFYADATPAETVRVVTNTPGLLKNAYYRPSHRQIIWARAETLARPDQELARALALGEITLDDEQLNISDDYIRAEILELAADYVVYLEALETNKKDFFEMKIPDHQIADNVAPDDVPYGDGSGGLAGDLAGEESADDENNRNRLDQQVLLHQLLAARSKVEVESQLPEIPAPRYRPDQGHRGRRIALRYGYEDPDQFLQMDFRWAYHDLYDPSRGYVQGAQLEFLQPAFRYYPEGNHFKFESIDFVNIISAPVRNYFIRPYSWEASASLKRYRFDENDRPLMGDVRAGIGVSYQLTEGSAASIFANGAINISDKFDQDVALAAGGRAEVMSTITDSWQVGLYAHAMQYFEGETQTSYRYGGTLRYSLGQNNAMVVDVGEDKEFGDSFFSTQLSWQFYF